MTPQSSGRLRGCSPEMLLFSLLKGPMDVAFGMRRDEVGPLLGTRGTFFPLLAAAWRGFAAPFGFVTLLHNKAY